MKQGIRIILCLLICGMLYVDQLSGQTARIDSLKQAIEKAQGKEQVEILNELSDAMANYDPNKALEYASKAVDKAKQVGNEQLVAESHQSEAYAYYKMGDLKNAIQANEAALKTYRELDDQQKVAEVINSMGALYTMKGDLVKAKAQFDKALALNQELGNDDRIPSILMNIGVIYKKQSRYEMALENFTKALEQFDENDSLSMGNAYANIGNVYGKLDEHTKAINMFQMASDIFDAIGNKRAYAKTISNIGTTYMGMDEHDRARAYLNEAKRLYEEMGAQRAMGKIIFNLANIENTQDNYEKALKHCQNALSHYRNNDNKLGQVQSNVLIGIIYLSQDKLQKAESSYNKAMQIMKEAKQDYLEEKGRIHNGLSQIYEKREQYQKALNEYKAYHHIRDSIDEQMTSDKIAELQSKFQYSELEKENEQLKADNLAKNLSLTKKRNEQNRLLIALLVVLLFVVLLLYWYFSKRKATHILSRKNKEIEHQKKELEKANATKDKFFSIIAHDLKTPFNSIIGFAELLDDEFESLSDNEKKEYIKNIRHSSELMLDLLENLLVWSRDQQGRIEWAPEDFHLKELVDYTRELLKNQAKNKGIKLNTSLQDDLIVYADKSMISTVLRNLVSNAIKFTGRDGKVNIQGHIIDNQAQVTVSDTGMGMSEDVRKHLFDEHQDIRSNGTENEKGTGLGLMLAKEFVEKNGGTIKVESKEGNGSDFIFTLPLANG
ncbi:MAG: tetratricopeptide repeat protein [Bacteroidales bacterium]|nr:tetratricopeptide repeat protein [Bacteroidales bacterium]